MAAHAVRRVQRCRVRLMTGQALSLDAAVVRAQMERAAGDIVAFRAGATCVRGLGVSMHIVTGATGPLMRILGEVETLGPPLHLVTAQALRMRRHEGAHGRIARGESWEILSERMAGDAVDLRELGHARELHRLFFMAAALLAGARGRNKPVDLSAVTFHAGEVLQGRRV